MRLVLDTSVLIAAFRSRHGASRRLLTLGLQDRFQMVCSAALFFEYETVLKRPKQKDAHGYTQQQIDEFLLRFAGIVVKPNSHILWRPQLRDPDDEHVLEAAINGRAEAIVTFNARDFLPAALQFGIQVLQPGVILKERFAHE